MATLCVNVDHVATLRQARGGRAPEPVHAAMEVERAGSSGVTIHLREDRRHIQDRDVRLVQEVVMGHMNLEMAATDEMLEIALSIHPAIVTLVPEKREELTTEGGLDIVNGGERLKRAIERLQTAGIIVSLFIDPEADQIRASKDIGADEIELHTGPYAHAHGRDAIQKELGKLKSTSHLAQELGLIVNAGHGLDYCNTGPVAAIPGMRELNIGHAIVGRAIFDGLNKAVSDMVRLIRESSTV